MVSLPLTTLLQLFGGVSALSISYRLYTFIHIYLRPSSLPRYQHGKPGSTYALITGASDGIGYGFAEALLASGFNIVIHGRNADKLAGVKDRLGKKYPNLDIRIVVADAGVNNADVEGIASTCASLPGKLSVLINNVGGLPPNTQFSSVVEMGEKDTDTCINMNARFPAQLTRALLPLLKKNGPSLVLNLGSTAGLNGMPYLVQYCASKAFNVRFSDALRVEMIAEGADVEVLGILVGNVLSNGNRTDVAGVTCSSAVMAQSSLDRVGCGYANVWGWWRHGLVQWFMDHTPSAIGQGQIIKMMRERKEAQAKELKQQ